MSSREDRREGGRSKRAECKHEIMSNAISNSNGLARQRTESNKQEETGVGSYEINIQSSRLGKHKSRRRYGKKRSKAEWLRVRANNSL